VNRALALVLIPALMATSSVMSALHTHAYSDHDHPEHHHGLAAHAHGVAWHPDDTNVHIEGCDPATHTVSFTFVCPAPPQVQSVDAEVSLPALPIPERRVERTVRHTDVRVHGPPSRTLASPRAPPLIALM
jgi:hypothetical protein